MAYNLVQFIFNDRPDDGDVVSFGSNGDISFIEGASTSASDLYVNMKGRTTDQIRDEFLRVFGLIIDPLGNFNGSSRSTNAPFLLNVSSDKYAWYYKEGEITSTSNDIVISYINRDDEGDAFFFVSASEYSASETDNCSKYISTEELSRVSESVRVNGVDVTSSVSFDGNIHSVELTRGQYERVDYIVDDKPFLTKFLFVDLFIDANITYVETTGFDGSTFVFNVDQNENSIFAFLSFEYSIDGINYTSSGVFSNQTQDFTIHVRDNLGCISTKLITVEDYDEFGSTGRNDYREIPSKSNSLMFHQKVEHEPCGNYKNDDNTDSSNSFASISYCEKQLFNSCDNILTQFKTNHEFISVKSIKKNGVEIDVPYVKISNNLRTDTMDARLFYDEDGSVLMYFTSGKIYNPNGTTEDYNLNGGLPDFAFIGNTFSIGEIKINIEEISYNEDLNSDVIVLSPFGSTDSKIIVSSTYNIFGYEVYEAVLDMSIYEGDEFFLRIELTDDTFSSLTFESELICVANNWEDTLFIEYYNSENTDVFYASGIKHNLRIPLEYIEDSTDDENETQETDASSYLVESYIYEADTFHFKRLTKELMRKVRIALAHEFVFINGIQYVKGASPEINPLIGTNLYRMSAKMIKSNGTTTTNQTNVDLASSNGILIPKLIDAGDSTFIEY